MHNSPKALITGLLALALLAGPASAHSSGHHHRAAQRGAARKGHRHTGAHARRACRRRARCAAPSGGTPAVRPSAAIPRTPRRTTRQERTPRAHPTPAASPAPVETAAVKPRTAAQNSAAVIAEVLASPCANTELAPTAEDLPLVRAAVLCLINRERAEHGLNPLGTDARLESAAEGHCAELISADYFAHVSPSGETPVDRIRRTGYIPGPSVGYVIGENLAWGTYSLATPQSIVSAWIASPGHLANILESQYTETGVGVVAAVPASVGGGAPGATYAQEFGVIIH